jgi:hypothetical protein
MTGAKMEPLTERVSRAYHRFAEQEALGRSALYETLARGAAADPAILDFLLSLPTEKRQPNLLFAAVRHLCGIAPTWPAFRASLLANDEAIRTCMLENATQTNEPARCATLLPVLAQLPQPLALIEVGASAGLCLLPDFYAYDYGDRQIAPTAGSPAAPVFRCVANAATPRPTATPQVVWRAGLDLNPLDVADPAQAAWLETLVWPEQTSRLEHLRAAMQIAADVRPRLRKGSLIGDDLELLCQDAPNNATLVVFHTAVLAYIADPAARQEFAVRVKSLCPYWIANESPRVFPDIAARTGPGPAGRFLLSVNGSPVAWTDPHGAAIDWIAD